MLHIRYGGDTNNIVYKIKFEDSARISSAPGEFLVGEEGQALVSAEVEGTYVGILQAKYGSQEITIKRWSFEIKRRAAFSFSSANWNATTSMGPEEGYEPSYYVDRTYDFRTPPLPKREMFDNYVESSDKIGYALTFQALNIGMFATGMEQPVQDNLLSPGRFFVDTKGGVFGKPCCVGAFRGYFKARDADGGFKLVCTRWLFLSCRAMCRCAVGQPGMVGGL